MKVDPEKYYTVKEVARLLAVSPRTIYYLISMGELIAYKIGKAWRIKGSDIIAFLKEHNSLEYDYEKNL